jgi:hypothetical protein
MVDLTPDQEAARKKLPFQETGDMIVGKAHATLKERHPHLRLSIAVIYYLFPVVLLLVGKCISLFKPGLRQPVSWEYTEVLPTLFVLLILAILWLIFDLFKVFSRETTSSALQYNNTLSIFLAIVFSIYLGMCIQDGWNIPWYLIIPLATSVINAFATGWAAINNATQKPFMTERGRQ